jgi:hypothetical protein
VVKAAADGYLACLVVETGPDEALPVTDAQASIDLGLSHFACR